MLFLVADVLTRRGDWLTKEYDQYTHIIVAGYITSNSRLRSTLLYIYQDLAKTLKCTAPTVGIVYTVKCIVCSVQCIVDVAVTVQ